MSTPVLLRQVLELWRQVLPAAVLQPDTHFFLAGGDSLQLARLLLRVQEQLGIRLRLEDISSFSTPRKMAQLCASNTSAAEGMAALSLPPLPAAGFVANSSQQGIWWSEQQAGNNGLYNSAIAVSLSGELQVTALAAAIKSLLQQFPLLAAGLAVDVTSRKLMVRASACPPELGKIHELSPQLLTSHVADWAAMAFELQREVFRCRLLRHGEQHHTLLLCVHHCVADGWSGGVLLQQLAHNYRELCRDPHWQPQQVDNAFAYHCQQQQRWLASADCQQHLLWWEQYLRDADAVSRQLPWKPAAMHWPYVLQRQTWPLPEALLQQLPSACMHRGCTPFSLLATAVAVALQRVGSSDRPLIGFPYAGRQNLQYEQSIGCYMQLLPLWLEASEETPWPTLLQRNHAAVQEVLLHAVPLPKLVQQLRPALLEDGNAWFDVVLALQNFPLAKGDWSPLTAGCQSVPPTHGQYALKLEFAAGQVCVEYASAVVDPAVLQHLLLTMQQVLTVLVTC